MAQRRKTDDAAESRRIIGQIEQQTGYDRAAGRPRPHLRGDDADQDDRIEALGTRIGRAIGFIATIAVVLLFIRYLVSA